MSLSGNAQRYLISRTVNLSREQTEYAVTPLFEMAVLKMPAFLSPAQQYHCGPIPGAGRIAAIPPAPRSLSTGAFLPDLRHLNSSTGSEPACPASQCLDSMPPVFITPSWFSGVYRRTCYDQWRTEARDRTRMRAFPLPRNNRAWTGSEPLS